MEKSQPPIGPYTAIEPLNADTRLHWKGYQVTQCVSCDFPIADCQLGKLVHWIECGCAPWEGHPTDSYVFKWPL
jgi:hypothetical protein